MSVPAGVCGNPVFQCVSPQRVGDVMNFLFVLQRSRHVTIFVSSLLNISLLVQTVETCFTRVEHKTGSMSWRRLADGLQTRPIIVLPAGLSGFGSEVGQKRPRLRSRRVSSPAAACRSA